MDAVEKRRGWLKVEDVALKLDKHPDTVRRYIRAGILPASWTFGEYWIPESAIDDLIQKNLGVRGGKKEIKPKKIRSGAASKRLKRPVKR
jgi:hypothetical protein